MKYKKYILFCFHSYEESGGLGDIQDSFDTLDEAKEEGKTWNIDSVYVVDRDTWEIVWDKYVK